MREIHKGHRALNLKPLEHKLTVVYIQTLDDIYEAIDATCFDIASRQIGDKTDKIYDIYCDDNGLLKDNAYLAAFGSPENLLVGDILIARHDSQGEMIDLTTEDIDYIGKHVYRYEDQAHRIVDYIYPIHYPNYTK